MPHPRLGRIDYVTISVLALERRLSPLGRLVEAILDMQALEHELGDAGRQRVRGLAGKRAVLGPLDEVADDLLQGRHFIQTADIVGGRHTVADGERLATLE